MIKQRIEEILSHRMMKQRILETVNPRMLKTETSRDNREF